MAYVTALILSLAIAAAPSQDDPPKGDKKVEKKKPLTRAELKKLDTEAKKRILAFKKGLRKLKGSEAFVTAIDELCETSHKRILSELGRWIKLRDKEIASAAVAQVGTYENSKVAALMLMSNASKHKDMDVVVASLEALGEVGFSPIARSLFNFFRHKSAEVAAKAVETCGALRSRDAITPLITLYREMDSIKPPEKDSSGLGDGGFLGGGAVQEQQLALKTTVTPAVEGALREITGKEFKTPREWQTWWSRNKRSFKLPAKVKEKEEDE